MDSLNQVGLTFLMACGAVLAAGCAEDAGPDRPSGVVDGGQQGGGDGITYRSAVQAVRSVDEAQPGVFIQPYEDCRDPVPGDTATRADGMVCTQVSISANVEPGKYYPDYASCEVVRRQRPYWPAAPIKVPNPSDPRLQDPAYVAELAWVTEQVAASGCICCHDSREVRASQWDINLGPTWLDTLSDTGLALFAGFADSTVLGAYPPAQNHGFDRDQTGIASTDSARMKAFMVAEMTHRGLTEEWARSVPPFGGPIYTNSVKQPEVCAAGQGVDVDGKVLWTGGAARYVYVLEQGSKNPGVPPNLDLPGGTVWRLDVLASAPALASGVPYGQTPAGSFQWFPEASPAQPLTQGKTYQLVALLDVGVPLVNCLFEFGRPVPPATTGQPSPVLDAGSSYPDAGSSYSDAGVSDAGAGDAAPMMCTAPGGDAKGFGAACNDTANHSDCPCEADYCSKSPFDSVGYCSVTGCLQNPGICPSGWRCTDLSAFQPGLPAVCARP